MSSSNWIITIRFSSGGIKAEPFFFVWDASIGGLVRLIGMDKHVVSEIVAMAWADEVPFDAIKEQFGVPEREVIRLMRSTLKPRSFELWRERVTGRKAKRRSLKKISPLGRKKERIKPRLRSWS